RCGGPYVPEPGDETYWTHTDPYTAVSPEWINICTTQLNSFASSEALPQADSIVLAFEWEQWFVQGHLDDALQQIRRRSTAPIYLVGRKEMLKSSIEFVNLHRQRDGLEHFPSHYIEPYTTD